MIRTLGLVIWIALILATALTLQVVANWVLSAASPSTSCGVGAVGGDVHRWRRNRSSHPWHLRVLAARVGTRSPAL